MEAIWRVGIDCATPRCERFALHIDAARPRLDARPYSPRCALIRRSLRGVPGEAAVIGYDDIPAAARRACHVRGEEDHSALTER